MRYRLKLTITIALLIAISFGIGGTLMITTSFNATLKQETQAALQSFESVQNTLFRMKVSCGYAQASVGLRVCTIF